jgi:hypothetical protein
VVAELYVSELRDHAAETYYLGFSYCVIQQGPDLMWLPPLSPTFVPLRLWLLCDGEGVRAKWCPGKSLTSRAQTIPHPPHSWRLGYGTSELPLVTFYTLEVMGG